jgi:hypothetical protein
MPEAVLDADLAEGLNAAKKTPRNFALIVKGVTPVKLMVQKKKFKDGDLMKAKTEAKGNDYIIGVLEASGSDFAFKVLGSEEPAVKTMKIKELIAEHAEITAKPRWVLVNELPSIGDEEESQQPTGQQQPPVPPPPVQQPSGQVPPPPPLQAPPPPQLDAKQLLAAMNRLSPQIQAAAQANPNRKNELTQPVAAFQQHIQGNDLEAAKADLSQLVALLKSMPRPTADQQPAASGGGGKFSIVKLGKARVEWLAVRDAALAGIRQLRQAIEAEFADDEEQTQQLREALATLDQKIRELEVRLHEELDQILNAEEQVRPGLIANTKKTVLQLTGFLDSDPIMGEIDDNEVVPGMRIIKPVRDKLTEISAALG